MDAVNPFTGLESLDAPWRVAVEQMWDSFRAGSIAVGAVLTDPAGVIVAAGRNRVHEVTAPAGRVCGTTVAHGELDVLVQLPSAPAGSWSGHTIYSTLEPCLVCAAAIVAHGIGTVRFAAPSAHWAGLDLAAAHPRLVGTGPVRYGPDDDPVARGLAPFCLLLPLATFLTMGPAVDPAVRARHPDAVALAERWLADGTFDRLRQDPLTVDEAFARVAADLPAR